MNVKIKVVLASSSQGLVKSQLANRQKALAPGTEITIVAPDKCPPSTEGEVDEVLAAPQILLEVAKAKKEGFDAVTIDCTLDPGLKAAKKVSSIPVVGAGEAALSIALLLGERFSIIMPTSESISPMISKVRQMGLWERLASVRSINVHVLDLEDHTRIISAVNREARIAIDRDGADVIVLGCTVMGPIADELSSHLGVPVIEPGTAAIKLAETLVLTKWSSPGR
ncbi:aspartate/glutamate racemase family protein [Candidatus Aerophobetes bacterium]|nr:aspartate/glutamate racemase family protein [Candidatus Aerophobetes bacterium]